MPAAAVQSTPRQSIAPLLRAALHHGPLPLNRFHRFRYIQELFLKELEQVLFASRQKVSITHRSQTTHIYSVRAATRIFNDY